MTHDEKIIEAMEQYGGSFVVTLAALWRRADSENRAKIKATWSNYWKEYESFIK